MGNKQLKITDEDVALAKVIIAAQEADAEWQKRNIDEVIIKHYLVSYFPDLAEGRGFRKTGVLEIGARFNHEKFAEHWCYEKYGNRIAFVVGAYNDVAITDNWRIRELYPYEVDSYKPLDSILV